MYKIYINETPLLLIEASVLEQYLPPTEGKMIARYTGKVKTILNYVDTLEKTDRFQSIVLYSDQPQQLMADFQSHYQIVEAAGGIVFNDQREILFIYRRGHWDLPKGKIDPGETREEAAVREIQEETGLEVVNLGPFFAETYHTYRDRQNKRVLKITYWFEMTTPDQKLIPQASEGIELAVWRSPDEFLANNRQPVFRNIQDLVEKIG